MINHLINHQSIGPSFHHQSTNQSFQWIGEAGLREAAEGRVVTAKLVCRDASPKSTFSGVFTPCVAFRVAGSPSKNSTYDKKEITVMLYIF